MESKPIAEQVADHLTAWLGKHNSKNAVKMFSMRTLKRPPEDLTIEDLPNLIDALRPMLRTLIGDESTGVVLDIVMKKVK